MRQPSRDSGFTLIEVLMTISLLGLMMGIAVAGFARYSNAHEQDGTARSLQSGLRQAQQRAVTEGRAMCVAFTATSYTVWRSACDATTGTKVEGPTMTESEAVQIELPAPQTLTFTPRGTATWPSIASDPMSPPACGGAKSFEIEVTRTSSTKTYRLCVVALTGRVDLHG